MKTRVKILSLMLLMVVTACAQQHKAVSILGDSYSTFRGFLEPDSNAVWYPFGRGNDVSEVTQTWWHILVKENGYRLCVNNSFSGATICFTGYNGEDFTNRSFVNRARYLGTPDIILVLGGTNDSWAGSPIGEYQYADWKPKDLFCFRPALARMMVELQERYPNVELYFILNSELKEVINESCRTICQHYGVKLIELHDIDKQLGHPSKLGMRQIAEQVKQGMDEK